MKISHIILAVLMIIFGIAFAVALLSGLFFEVKLISFIGLVIYIPTLLVVTVLPVYAGIGMIIEMIKDREKKDATQTETSAR